MSPRKQRLTRAEAKARTRTDLLRAANRLFLRNGFVATSVAEIAEEAGLTTGAVYSNFETKEDLFLALVEEMGNPESPWISEDQTAPADLASATGATPSERVSQWGRTVGKIRPDRRTIALIMEMNAAALRSERSRECVVEHNLRFFRELGAELAEVLDAPAEDAELLGLMAQTIYSGLTAHVALTGVPLSDEVWARAYRLLAAFAHDSSDAPV